MEALETGQRRSALLLHAMPAGDADWLLKQLPPADRAPVAGMLAELRELGMPAQPEVLREVIGKTPSAPPVAAQGGASDPERIAFLRAAPAPALAAVLRHEPAMLTARLLGIDAWPWRTALLAEFDAPRRRQVEDCLAALAPACPPALASAVLAELAPAVRAHARPGALAATPWWRRRLAVLRRRPPASRRPSLPSGGRP